MSKNCTVVYDLLICVYTCEKHRDLLGRFHKSILGQYLGRLERVKILEVYADPDINQSFHNESELILKAQEEYEALSLKTQKMINYCVSHFEFQHLLKIDVAAVRTQLDGSEFAGRKPVDLDKLLLFLKRNSFDADYDGFINQQNASRKGAENWAAKKGKIICYERVFGKSTKLPQFYTGLCYIVSKRFAQYIGEFGQPMATEHHKYFLGSEDVMIGRLYNEFLKMFPCSKHGIK